MPMQHTYAEGMTDEEKRRQRRNARKAAREAGTYPEGNTTTKAPAAPKTSSTSSRRQAPNVPPNPVQGNRKAYQGMVDKPTRPSVPVSDGWRHLGGVSDLYVRQTQQYIASVSLTTDNLRYRGYFRIGSGAVKPICIERTPTEVMEVLNNTIKEAGYDK